MLYIHICMFKMKISKLVQNPRSCALNTAARVSLLHVSHVTSLLSSEMCGGPTSHSGRTSNPKCL